MAADWDQPLWKEEVQLNESFHHSSYEADGGDYSYGLPTSKQYVPDVSRDISKEIFQPPAVNSITNGEAADLVKCSSPIGYANGNYTNLSSMSPVITNSENNVICLKPEFEESGYDDFARELIKEELITDIQKKLWSEYDNSYSSYPSAQDQFGDEMKMFSYDGSQHSEVTSNTNDDNDDDFDDADGSEAEAMRFVPIAIVRNVSVKRKKKGKKSKVLKSKPCSVSLHKIRVNEEGEWSGPRSECVKCTPPNTPHKQDKKHAEGDVRTALSDEGWVGGEGEGGQDDRPFKCSLCDKAFYKKYGLKKHLIVHSDERPFKCDICPKEFRRLDSLHLHRRTHTKERISCNTCCKIFSRAESLRKHRCSYQVKDRVPKRFNCTICDGEFSQMTDLRKHMRAHTKDGSFVCSVCGKSYSRLYHLQQHEGRHTGLLPKCVICGKCFLKEDSLKQHVQLHSAVIEKKCEECGKDLHSLNSIRYHKIMHSGKKQYKCDVCGKEFYMLGHMRFHKKMHETDKKYTCGECGKNFFWLRSFQAHQLTHTKSQMSCRSCYKTFTDEKVLQRHLLRKGH